MILKHVKKDLFDIDSNKVVYAHCVAKDGAMGAGIAKTFTEKYPELRDKFKAQKPKLGDAIRVETEDAVIYNLVTKEVSYEKPVDHSAMAYALQNMKKSMMAHDEKYAAVPLLGAGLDNLPWNKTQYVIENVFKDTDIAIGVAHTDSIEGYQNIKTKGVSGEKGYRMALTGHRPKDFLAENGNVYDLKDPTYQKLYAELKSHAEQKLQEHGKITIISGMALGADTVWAYVGSNMKKEHGDKVRFEAHSPLEAHDSRWADSAKAEYRRLLKDADEVVYYTPSYSARAMQDRNVGMVDNSDELVAAYNGFSNQNSGTYNAISYARKVNKDIHYTSTEYFKKEKNSPVVEKNTTKSIERESSKSKDVADYWGF